MATFTEMFDMNDIDPFVDYLFISFYYIAII